MLTKQFLAYINKENLFKTTDKVLLAISGGLDSVVLAHLLKEIDQDFSLAHMNFQLRGEDSDLDEAFLQKLATDLGVHLHTKRVTIDKQHAGASTQMQARDLRYTWFEHLMETESYKYVLTAHHLNDSFETTLHNLSRGTGINGLRGILPKRASMVRPLLFSTKKALKSYAVEKDIKWREDVSNASINYKRNFFRHKLVPLFEELNPKLIANFEATTQRLTAAAAAYKSKIAEMRIRFSSREGDVTFFQKALLKEENGRVIFFEMVSQYGFTFAQIDQFDFSRTGATLFSASHQIQSDRSTIILKVINDPWSTIKPITFRAKEGLQASLFELQVKIAAGNTLSVKDDPYTISLDLDLLAEKLTIRPWQQGDRFQPLGMKGQKKVSDLLIDKKVPLSLKDKQLVLTSEEEIVWLVGDRMNDKFKITEHTSQQLRLSYIALK